MMKTMVNSVRWVCQTLIEKSVQTTLTPAEEFNLRHEGCPDEYIVKEEPYGNSMSYTNKNIIVTLFHALSALDEWDRFRKPSGKERTLLRNKIIKSQGDYHLIMEEGDMEVIFLDGLYGEEGEPQHTTQKRNLRIKANNAFVRESHCQWRGRTEDYRGELKLATKEDLVTALNTLIKCI